MNEVLDCVEVRTNGEWAGVFTARALQEGDRVLEIRGTERSSPDRYSIQVDEQTHVHPDDEMWKYLNHSCRPNLVFDHESLTFVACRPIDKGEDLSFNYLTTEWDMYASFDCHCGMADCYRKISGFQHLSQAEQRALLPKVAPHIRALLARAS